MSDDTDIPQRWIVAICSVLFDVDIGQKIDSVYPPDAITEAEKADVAFHAFPDSLSMELHSVSNVKDSSFFFRVRRNEDDEDCGPDGSDKALTRQGSDMAHHRDASADSSHYQGQLDTYLYGYVFCRQRQDERLRRGAEQKSVVVLSEHPYSSVLRPLSHYTGPLYFNEGAAALKQSRGSQLSVQMYDEVMAWPAPEFGLRSVLPVGTLSIPATIPPPSVLPPPSTADVLDSNGALPGADGILPENLLGTFHEMDVYTPFRSVLKQLWVLWELMLLAEPVLVVGPTPGDCSCAVASLLSLMAPLPYSADFRPYFTIHDKTFAAMSYGELPGNQNGLPRLLGITNLYFIKALPKWPSVLSVGSVPQRTNSGSNLSGEGMVKPVKPKGHILDRRSRQGPIYLLTERIETLWTCHKPATRPNAKIMKVISDNQRGASGFPTSRLSSINSSILRKHFVQLTIAFLEPFRPFFEPIAGNALCPLNPGLTPSATPDAEGIFLKPFSRTNFMEEMKSYDFPDVLKATFVNTSACVAFYKKFLESPNFLAWFERRRHGLWLWQQRAGRRIKLEQVMSLNPYMDEVQMIELFYKYEQRLANAASAHASNPSAQNCRVLAHLKRELSLVFETMPRDLQQTILSAPHRAALIHSLHIADSRVPGVPHRVSSEGAVVAQSLTGASTGGERLSSWSSSPPPHQLVLEPLTT